MVSCLYYSVPQIYNKNRLYDLTKLTRPLSERYKITAVMSDETDIISSISTSPIVKVVILVIIYVEIVTDDVLVVIDKSLNCHKIRNRLRPSIIYFYKAWIEMTQ